MKRIRRKIGAAAAVAWIMAAPVAVAAPWRAESMPAGNRFLEPRVEVYVANAETRQVLFIARTLTELRIGLDLSEGDERLVVATVDPAILRIDRSELLDLKAVTCGDGHNALRRAMVDAKRIELVFPTPQDCAPIGDLVARLTDAFAVDFIYMERAGIRGSSFEISGGGAFARELAMEPPPELKR